MDADIELKVQKDLDDVLNRVKTEKAYFCFRVRRKVFDALVTEKFNVSAYYDSRDDSLAEQEKYSSRKKTIEEVDTFNLTNLKLDSEARVLDIGCAEGDRSLKYKTNLNTKVLGLDYSPIKCQKARDNGLPVVRGDMRRLPFADESFDAALMLYGGVAHLSRAEMPKVIQETARILKEGGQFCLDILASQKGNPEGYGIVYGEPKHFGVAYVFGQQEIENLINRNGLTIKKFEQQKLESTDFPEFMILATRV